MVGQCSLGLHTVQAEPCISQIDLPSICEHFLYHQQIKILEPHDPAWGKIESTLWKRYLYTHVHSSVICNNWSMRAIQVPTDWKIDEPMWQAQIIRDYLPLKRKGILTHTTTWRNLVHILLNEINLTGKDKYSVIPLKWSIWSDHIHQDREEKGNFQELVEEK